MAPSKGVMLKKLPNVLQPLLRMLRMASQDQPPNIAGLFTSSEASFVKPDTLDSWYNTVFNNVLTLDCRIHTVSHNKISDGVRHEYLLFEIKFRDVDQCTSILIAERNACKGHESSSKGSLASNNECRSYSSSVTSSSRPDADDTIYHVTKPSRACDQLERKFRKGSPARQLTFGEGVKPSVHELATLLRVVSGCEPKYDVCSTQCYWFAGKVFDALNQRFGGTVQVFSGCTPGEWNRIPIHTKPSLEQILGEYDGARAAWIEQCRQEQLRFEDMRREVQRAQAAEESERKLREAAQAAEESERKLREAAQAAEESERKLREAAQAENARLRKELEASERKVREAAQAENARLRKQLEEFLRGPSTSDG